MAAANTRILHNTRQAADDPPFYPPGTAPPPKGFVHLHLWPHGRGTVTATIDNPAPGESVHPTGTYLPGRVVRLEARPDSTEGPSAFGAWSDNRCPAGPVCELRMDADPASQSIAALFSPQPVIVAMLPSSDRATVTSVPPGIMCEGSDRPEGVFCSAADFPLFTDVALSAEGTDPVWGPQCDRVVGATCYVSVQMTRNVAVGFHGKDPGPTPGGGYLGVHFHVVKAGTGSGRVQGKLIDCGRKCTTDGPFGTPQTLTADPDAGSRFVGWKGACGRAPRCGLFMGPVTRLAAVFDVAATARPTGAPGGKKRGGGDGNAGTGSREGRRTAFKANIGDIEIRRVRGRRVIQFRVRVSSRATVRARLGRKAGSVVARTWQVRSGVRQLRLRVPRKARSGLYRLRISARGHTGTTKVFTRPLMW
jgi:hypothetical protein